MRAIWISTLALAVVVGGVSLALGQQSTTEPAKGQDAKTDAQPKPPTNPYKEVLPKTTSEPAKKGQDAKTDAVPPKTKLEEMLQQAMRHNPDIRVAEAKMAEAEAELNRTRLVVMQKVVLYQANLDDAKTKVEFAESQMKRLRDLTDKGAVPAGAVQTAAAALQSAKAELAKVEAELPLLLGTAGQDKKREMTQRAVEYLALLQGQHNSSDCAGCHGPLQGQHNSSVTREALHALYQVGFKPPVPGPMAERIRKALDKPIMGSFSGTPKGILSDLLGAVEDVPFRIQLTDEELSPTPIDLNFQQKVPLGAIIQAYQDSASPHLRLVVRDYGILVTDDKHIPPGASLLYDVWKGGKETAILKVEGLVKQVDEEARLVYIALGSENGLKMGDTLEVFRPSEKGTKPLSLGQVRLNTVNPTESVGQIVSPQKQTAIQKGDRVTNILPDK